MAKQLVAKESNVTDAAYQKHIRLITAASLDMKEQKATFDTSRGRYQASVKAAKADGIATTQLLEAMKSRLREPDDVHADLRNYVRCLALLNMPVNQLDLFGANIVAKPAAEPDTDVNGDLTEHARFEIEEAGRTVGASGGLASDNPHFAGTEGHTLWHTGWAKAARKIAAGRKNGSPKLASTRRTRASTAASA